MRIGSMELLSQLTLKVKNLDDASYKRLFIITIAVIMLVVGGVFWYYHRSTQDLKKLITRINTQREEVQQTLVQLDHVKKQRSTVEQLLAEEKNFRIKSYFSTVIEHLKLVGNQTKDPEVTQHELLEQYDEIQLTAHFHGLNTLQLCELLATLEKKQRVYTKTLDITRGAQKDTIAVNLSIATLKPKIDIPEAE